MGLAKFESSRSTESQPFLPAHIDCHPREHAPESPDCPLGGQWGKFAQVSHLTFEPSPVRTQAQQEQRRFRSPTHTASLSILRIPVASRGGLLAANVSNGLYALISNLETRTCG